MSEHRFGCPHTCLDVCAAIKGSLWMSEYLCAHASDMQTCVNMFMCLYTNPDPPLDTQRSLDINQDTCSETQIPNWTLKECPDTKLDNLHMSNFNFISLYNTVITARVSTVLYKIYKTIA